MSDDERASTNVMLVGGPPEFPRSARVQRVVPGLPKIKIMYRGGYEHFEPDPIERAERDQVVYRWTGRTNIAE